MSGYAHPEALVDTQWGAEHLTAPKVRLYDGSWAEWSTLIGVPIEK
jgi:3-mercaptopyruvate sulfurtransferase SseA